MQYSDLQNYEKPNTVENVAKEIFKRQYLKSKLDIIDPKSPSRNFEKTLVDKLLEKISLDKDAVLINMYRIQQKDAIMKNIEKDRIENMKSPLQLNQKIRTFSPQPCLSYIGFRKKAFFNKRQGILKQGLKLKKINIFADIKEDFPNYLLRSNIKQRFLSPKMCERSDINYSNCCDSKTFDLKSCYEDRKSLQQNQTMLLNHNKKLADQIILHTPFHKKSKGEKRKASNFDSIISDFEIKEYSKQIWNQAHQKHE